MLKQFVNTQFLATLAVVASVSNFALAEDSEAFSMKITDTSTIKDSGTLITGESATGSLEVGDTVCVPLIDTQKLPKKVLAIDAIDAVVGDTEVGSAVGVLVEGIGAKEIKKGERLTTDCVAFSDIPEED